MKTNRSPSCCLLLLILVSSAYAGGQEDPEHHRHGGEGEKIGTVNFSTSCSPGTRKQFNRAVAWLHSFEYDDAERAFAAVAASDSRCAMAHWGVAMSFYHQLWAPPSRAELQKGFEAAKKAKQLDAKTKRERTYITAIGEFYRDWDTLDHRTRAVRYERAMEALYKRYPRDSEAGVFYALALNATALATVPMDKTYAKQRRAGAILSRVLRVEPDHPGATHYLIHSYDYPQLARLALNAARRYARIAPSSSHALHMPSHIFTRLGLWEEDISANIVSEAAAKDFARRNHLMGAWDEQLHSMDYLEYAYLQTGRDREARSVLDELRSIHKTDPENFKCAYSFAAIPARWALERRQWSEAANLAVQPADFPWRQFQWAEAITHFARALGAARSGDAARAREEVEKLASIQKALSGARSNYDWATQVEVQRRAASGWLAKLEGKDDEALELMRSAATLEDSTDKHPVTPGAVVPSRELLGELLLELNRPADALTEFEKSLVDSPNRLNGLFGAARSAELAGLNKRAAALYEKMIELCAHADGERVELEKARAFLADRKRRSKNNR